MRTRASCSFVLTFLLFLGGIHAGVAGAASNRQYRISDRSALILSVPSGWAAHAESKGAKAPITIHFSPESGAAFSVQVTPRALAGDARNASDEDLKRGVLGAAEGAKAQAVEELLPAVELVGTRARGYYFRATDRAPKPGEYKHLAQGMVGLGDVRLAFTILTNDGQDAVVYQALGMVRSARVAGGKETRSEATVPPPAAAPASVVTAVAGDPGTPNAERLQGLLAAGNFAQLDAELSAYQAAYRAGAINDGQAAKPFIVLTQNDPDLKPQYDKWVAEMPRSYVARIARGHYLQELGYLARGSDRAAKTSMAQFDAMGAYFKTAMEDCEASLNLDPKPVLGYGTMISIAQAVGAPELPEELVGEAIALDPRVITARWAYMESLRPEWGGSLEKMDRVLDSWKGAVEPAQWQALHRMVEDAHWRARLKPGEALIEKKQYQQAIEFYSEALKQAPVIRAYANRGRSYAELGQHDKAIEDYTRVLEIDPSGGCCSGTRSGRAQSYLKLGNIDKALADLTYAAEADDRWAARELALMYAFGKYGFKRDYKTARRWCERAAKQGDGLSMYSVGSIHHAGLDTPKNPALAAKWFEGAASRGIADAQADLAFMLWNGQGVAQNKDQAVKWWRASARQGNARSMKQLESNLSWLEYFRKVSLPNWVESMKASSPWSYLLMRYLGLGDD